MRRPQMVVFSGTALFLGPFLVRRETEKAFLAAAKPKDGRVRVVCLRTAKHWGSSANYKLRCARCALRDKVPEGSGRFREVPVHVAGQSSGGFWKVPRGVREFRVQMPTATSRMSYMSVASCHRRGDFLGTAPRLPAPESACIGHVGHVFGPCWLQLG